MNNKPLSKARIKQFNPDKVPLLAEMLKKQPLSLEQIANILEVGQKTSHNNRNNVTLRCIETIASNGYPIYSPYDGFYRVLTKEILDEYENEHSTKLQALYNEYCNGEYL